MATGFRISGLGRIDSEDVAAAGIVDVRSKMSEALDQEVQMVTAHDPLVHTILCFLNTSPA